MSTLRRFPYHWIVLAGAALGLTVSYAPLLMFTFGVFLKPLAAEFGWQRGPAAAIVSFTVIAQALLLPFLGSVVDRVGARQVLLPSLAGLGLVTLLLSIMPSEIWMWYAVFVLIVPVVGAGSGGLVYTRIITSWFDRRRGIALGITISGIGLGAMIFPPVTQMIIDAYSWRAAYVVLGGAALIIGLPIVAITLRNTPEEMGYAQDYGRLDPDHNGEASAPQKGLSLQEARRLPSFWLIVSAIFLIGITITGSMVHLASMLTDRGIDAQTAATMVGVLGGASMISRIFVGILFDRFFAPRVAVLFTAAALISSLILASGSDAVWLGFAAATLLGLGLGAEIDFMAYLVGRYFGAMHFGAIYGVLLAVFNIGAGVGAAAIGFAFDAFGSYTRALYVAAAIIAIACGLLLMLGPYPEFGRVGAQSDKEHI